MGSASRARDRSFTRVSRYLPAPMIIGFIIFLLLLGLGTFFVAMRGGPRGARRSLHTESRAGQRLGLLVVVVLVVFGLAVPALVLAFNAHHKTSVAVGGLHWTPAQQKGRVLFAQA